MNRYIYGMRERGASIGAMPGKGIIEIKNDRKTCDRYGQAKGRYYHSIVSYSRMLTAKEMEAYDMDYLEVQ